MKRLGIIILLTYVLAIAIHYHIYVTHRVNNTLFTQMLYLPSGKYLKPASLGYYSVLSDFIYLWSIQYYGDPAFSPRMEYLKHTYDIIVDLDPYYLDAYQIGALFMFFDGRNPDAGLALLDKGFQNNPKEWIIPADAGFYCMMNLKDYARAGVYFKKAAEVPGAPAQAKRLLAGMHFRQGDKVHAYQLWKEIYETSKKPAIKQTAYQHVHDLKVLLDLDNIRKAISEYHKNSGSYPLNLQQLVGAQYLSEIPIDPDGNLYVYKPQTGEVEYSRELNVYKRYQ